MLTRHGRKILVLVGAIGLGCIAMLKPNLSGKSLPSAADKSPSLAREAINPLAFDLYRELGKRPGNLFYSPYSIGTALAMVYAGARGDTAREMAQTMHLDRLGTPDTVHPAFGQLVASLQRADRPYELSTANALWLQEGYPFRREYVQTIAQYYRGQLFPASFTSAPEQARLRINQWVEEQTKQRIKELFKPGTLDPDIRLVLVNAIYFKGTWAKQFDAKLTKEEVFYAEGRRPVRTPMMRLLDERWLYFEDERLQALAMPYKGNELSMVILLPRRRDGLADLEQALTWEEWNKVYRALRSRPVQVSIPRFRLLSEFSLKDTLMELGMKSLFVPGQADLSGIDDTRKLFVSVAVHKAFVEVNEKGTEAAAATGIGVKVTSVQPFEPAVFVADHPFLFAIVERQSGALLFMGRLVSPDKE
ncbi:MAG: hypothetical protein C4297_13760 [Gemmataceae bacterium]